MPPLEQEGICTVGLDGFLLPSLLEEITGISSRGEQLVFPIEPFCVSK